MRRSGLIKRIYLVAILMIAVSCERRPLEEQYFESALIPVKIDWSNSGIPVTDASGNGYVHRVSLRFFPKNGSSPFDRYMETNVIEGNIEVPIGEYSVIVFNESVHDIYWEDAIFFTDINSYSDFAANIVADNSSNYPLYTPLSGENLIIEPYMLSSWSIDDFSVTDDMVWQTRWQSGIPTPQTNTMINALSNIVMRQLSYKVTVKAWVENLCSAQLIQCAARGFAQKVYMASAQTTQTPATHLFLLNSRRWDDVSQINGTVENAFLSFGRLPQQSQYWLNMDVLFTTGELYNQPLLYDVSNQVLNQTLMNIEINININLPYVAGGIYVGDWDDETIILK
jgi:hypothetical protein